MKLRVFGSKSCHRCELMVNGLNILSIPFNFVDANSDDQQKLCDLHNVEGLPHVQILDDNDKVVWEKALTVSLTDVVLRYKNYEVESGTRGSGELS